MQDRFLRHNLIDWFDQDRVFQANIIIVGAGAIGNEVIKCLALLGIGHLHIIDFDLIEEHNLTRSVLFRPSDIGKYKAQVAAESCVNINPGTKAKVATCDCWDAISFSDLDRADAVISCVDSFETRFHLNTLCHMTMTDFYNTSIDSRFARVEIFPFSSGRDQSCYECNLPLSVYENVQKRYSCGWLRKVAFQEKKIPTTTITSTIAGSMVSSFLLHRLCKHPSAVADSCQVLMDTINFNSTFAGIPKNDSCIGCGISSRDHVFVRAKRRLDEGRLIPLIQSNQGDIILSDPVVTTGTCTKCHRTASYFECARRLNDSISMCVDCGTQSMALKIVERVPIYEFRDIFYNHPVPCKYLRWDGEEATILIELED